MNQDVDSAAVLVDEIVEGLEAQPLRAGVTVVLCPSFPSLFAASVGLNGTPLYLGAQNLHYENDGAFTGEVSASMLRAAGCDYVIVGHSERRQYFHEDDATVNRKVRKAVDSGLVPIICVGETLAQREAGITESIVGTQIHEAFEGVPREAASTVIVAYEPVWAIGTGRTATPAQAQQAHVFIRSQLEALYGTEIASGIIIQYGGSMKPENALELLLQPDIDGGLIGGASIISRQFLAIIAAANTALDNRIK